MSTPPHSERAEAAVLGAVLADPRLLPLVADILKPEDFFIERHRLIFAAMLSLERAGQGLDHITLAEKLEEGGTLRKVGGAPYLMELDQRAPLPHHAVEYAQRVKELAIQRAVLAALDKAREQAGRPGLPIGQLVSDLTAQLTQSTARRKPLTNGTEVLTRVLDRSDEAQKGNKSTRLLRTNLRAWDDNFRGVPLEELTVIAAHPAVGKTSLAGGMAEAMASGGPEADAVPVSYHSLEDNGEALVRRFLSAASELPIRQISEPGMTEAQRERRDKGAEALHSRLANLWMDDERGQNVHSVANKIRHAVVMHGVRVAFVDHLLEMVGFDDDRQQNERVGEILRVLRETAASLRIAVVLCVHLRRGKDESIDYRYIRPGLQAIAGSEYVARMARLVVGLWFAKPGPEPRPPKPIAQPRIPKKATREEAEEILEKWQEKKREAENEYNKALARWREDTENKANAIVCTALKVTEGQQMQDIMLTRILYAGLVDRWK